MNSDTPEFGEKSKQPPNAAPNVPLPEFKKALDALHYKYKGRLGPAK